MGRREPGSQSSQSGLTAIELAVVVAILAVLASLAAIGLTGMSQSADATARITDAAEVQKAVDRWTGEQPAARYPVGTPVIVDGGNVVQASAMPAANGLAAKGSGLYARIVFSDTFSSPEVVAHTFVPDALQRLPKYGGEQPVPWVIDENGTVKLLAVVVGASPGAGTPTPTSTPAPTATPASTPAPSPTATPTTVPGTPPSVVGSAALPAPPRLIAASAANQRAYAAVGESWNAATYYLTVIEGTSVVANIAIGAGDSSTGPTWLAVNSASNRVYVSHTGANFAHAINGETNAIIGTIATGYYPEGIVTDPTTNRLYIANTNSGNVSVFDTTNDANSLTTTIAIPGSGAGITNLYLAVIPSTHQLFVSAPGLNKIFVVDTVSNAVTQTWSLAWAPSSAIVANGSTNRLYVGSGATVQVLNAADGASIATIPVASGTVRYLAINTTLNRLYATNSDTPVLTVIDATSNGVRAMANVAGNAQSVAADASNNRVYVATTANTVVVLSDAP